MGSARIDRRTFLRTATLAAAGTGILGIARPADAGDRLTRFLQAKLQDSHCPGLGLAAVYGGKVVWARGLGLANVARERRVRDTTMFMLASVSKTVTATAVMQVWEQGDIGLDDDVNAVLPFPVRNPAHPSLPITTRHLLTHTSGIRDNWSVLSSLYVKGDSPIALGTFLRRYLVPGGAYFSAARNFTTWAPGTGSLYSNVGAALAGYLVEAATGVPFDAWCEQRIFEPLGMRDTGWHLAVLDRRRIARPYRRLAGGGWKSYGHYGYPDYPDGQLRTTPLSLAKFLAAYARSGDPILQPATVDLMLRDQNVPGPWQGLIWYQSQGPGGPLVGHSGGDKGVATEMWFRRSDGAGAVVLANGDAYGGYDDLKDIRDRLIRDAASL